MSQQQPELPEGAIPTEIDAVPQDEVCIDADEVNNAAEAMIADGEFGEEEPLPVGANDPDVLADQPADPPGMPHQPDDLDREMAARAQEYVDRFDVRNARPRSEVRPDSATLIDARHEKIISDIRTRNVREALLRHVQETAHVERMAVSEYARALQTVQEARDEYVVARDTRLGAEEALFVMGLDIEGDHEDVEPSAPAVIPDDAIV